MIDVESTGESAGYGVVLSAIQEELAAEDRRKDSIEKRGLGVISSAGTLVTVLFALAAVVTAQEGYVAPKSALVLLLVSLGLFTIAGVFPLLSNNVRGYERISAQALKGALNEDPDVLTAGRARKVAAREYADVLIDARRKTSVKAKYLSWGLSVEVAAIGTTSLDLSWVGLVVV